MNSPVACPRSYVVLVDPNGLRWGRHPQFVEGKGLVMGVLEPVDFAITGRCHVARRDLERSVGNVECASSFGYEPNVAGSDVIVRCRIVTRAICDVIRLEIGEAEHLFRDEIDASPPIPRRIERGQVGAADHMGHLAKLLRRSDRRSVIGEHPSGVDG